MQDDDESGVPTGGSREGAGSQLRLLEANSASVFVRQLWLNIDPARTPPLSCYAWNLGISNDGVASLQEAPGCITEILSEAQMMELAAVYFAQVAPVYNFLDEQYVQGAITRRWQTGACSMPADAMLCGVGALGCLFGGRTTGTRIERRLVESARSALEYSSSIASPRTEHVVGWLLRTIYLRATSSPQATWMACCTLMHMIETTKLHLEPSDSWLLADGADRTECDPELRRRIYWVSQLFNTWVSSDCGKSEVDLRGASSSLPGPSWTKEQQELCRISYALGQTFEFHATEIDAEMARLRALSPDQPMLRLLQCNIGLCFFRRLRALGQTMTDSSLESLLDLAKESLAAVDVLVQVSCPWWHVINIPFQLVCVLLVVDTEAALGLLAEGLDVLKRVLERYSTPTARETYDTARFLVTQERQRRSKRIEHLATALQGHGPLPGLTGPEPLQDAGQWQGFPDTPGLFDAELDLNGPLVDYFFFGHPFPQN